MTTSLSLVGIRVSPLTNQIVLARFGKDPQLALDTRNVENEFFQALCSYAFDHKMPEPGHGGVIQFGAADEQFTAIVRRFSSKEDADKDTTLRNAAPDLLEACQKIVNNWGNLHPKDRAQLRAAIAKAEGGAA
ncbi:hypothetical protein [Neorhizobium sp. SOG26]|uniref:hypothetical protein n=1 Tax=Neorhizobium sp. SOG26 TaxID=2060726 RepID=UPI00123780BB|nr:hypothetical protein [Neorhizobium sp. SOG26]